MNTFGHALSASIPAGFTTWRVSAFFLAMMLALSGCLQQEEAMMSGAGSVGVDDVAADDGEDVSMTGELTVLYMDDFENQFTEIQFSILDKKSKKKYKLKFKDTPPGHLQSGMDVNIRGKAKGKEIILAANGIESSNDPIALAAAAASGEQKALVMVANFNDASVSCPINDIRDLMFADAADQSIDDLYRETSFGKAWISGQVVGDYNINFSSTDSCDIEAWANAADAEALANGVNIADFPRKVYVLPRGSCPGSGYGTVGGNSSRAWIFTCHIADVFAHEIGHNLGMGHAATPSYTYGDTSDFMGLGGGPLRQVNAPHKEQVGWLEDFDTQVITAPGTYDIAPLELAATEAIAPRALKILKQDTNDYYYLSYRRGIGFDANLSGSRYLDHLTVHLYQGDGSASRTYALATLADDESFRDSVNGITVTQLSHNGDYVTVQLSLAGSTPPPTCTSASPLVSLSPPSQTAPAGSNVVYNVNVTNQDSAACDASSFALSNSVPSGWSGAVSPASLDLSPGQIGTATLSVASASAAVADIYNVSVTAADNTEVAHTGTGNANYTIVGVCEPAAPGMTVSPVSQNGDPGVTRVYTVSLVNNDNAACSTSTFDLSTSSLPSGWGTSLSATTLSLAPGSSGTASLSVTSATTAAPDSYSVQVAAADAREATHTTSKGIAYVVNDTTPTADVEPPTTPAGLAANANSRRVNLSWSAATDNVGVAGYRVYRDSVLIATTVDPVYSDRGGASGVTYAYTVAAYDGANNASAMSAPVMASKGSRSKGKRPRK